MTIQMINDVHINETFRSFDNTFMSGMYPVDDWEIIYDLEKSDGFFGQDVKVAIIRVWVASSYDVKNRKKYGGMYSYSEVSNRNTNEKISKSFFGEDSESAAFRWASDKADKIVYER